MAELDLNCDRCGGKVNEETGVVIGKTNKVYCQLSCYKQIGRSTNCVSRFNLNEELLTDKPLNLFYTCDTVQLGTETIKVGAKITSSKDKTKPDLHPNATQVIILFEGSAMVTIYQDGQAFPMLISDSVDEKNIIVIPPNVPHMIENVGKVDVRFMTIYSPPVHPVSK